MHRFALRVRDRLRFDPRARALACHWCWKRAAAAAKRDPGQALRWWCAAARLAASPKEMQRAEAAAAGLLDALGPEEIWRLAPAPAPEVTIRKGAILKTPGENGEKGVMIISFEHQWAQLPALGQARLGRLLAQYQLVLSPTWSPPHHPVNFLFPRLVRTPLITTISNQADLQILPRLHADYRPQPLYASSWVNGELYAPRGPEERDIDLVMIANFASYKRHHVLFRALARGGASTLKRIVLIGQPEGKRTAEALLQEAERFGVRNRIELRVQVSDAELVACLCRGKASFIASRREGSCVAVVEAMMAGTPVGLLRGAAIGSAAFLNEQTGLWLDEDRLASGLEELVASHAQFRPREWLLANGVECRASTERLNEALREEALRQGNTWRENIWVHHWRPDPLLLDGDNVPAARREAERLRDELGLRLASPQLLSS